MWPVLQIDVCKVLVSILCHTVVQLRDMYQVYLSSDNSKSCSVLFCFIKKELILLIKHTFVIEVYAGQYDYN